MILAPASYRLAAGEGWDPMPLSSVWQAPRRLVARRMAQPGELAGLGSFFHKLTSTITSIARAPIKLISPKAADNLKKVDDKVLSVQDKVSTKINDAAHSVGHFVSKNWKWIAVVVAIAITIYTMGAGATIAAHMISGMQALGAHIASGAATVWHAVVGTSAATGTAAASGTTAAAGSSGWLATTGKLALSAAQALQAKAKVSDLSQQQAQAMLDAQSAGYDLGASDPQLAAALMQRASIPGNGIPTDAQGNPMVEAPTGWGTTPAPNAAPVSSLVIPVAPSTPTSMPQAQVMPVGYPAGYPVAPVPAPSSMASLTSSPYFLPAAIGGGALLLVLLLRR
jgi:ElaB/YqjD/DUF883 family membrane-anchored ribosome-binding protein